MKTKITAALVLLAAVAGAASHTFVLGAAAETKLTRTRTILAAQGEVYADNDALITAVCTPAVVSKIESVEGSEAQAMASRFFAASQAQRDAGCVALGGTVVNGRCQ